MQRIYVRRNEAGQIVAVSLVQEKGFSEAVSPTSPELESFAFDLVPGRDLLTESDLGLVRVLEDLIELLITKEVILFTDLPTPAQDKLLGRKSLRSSLGGLNLLSEIQQDSV